MEVILRDHVENLGRRGEIVKVADGYARNYLLPRKLALPATDANRKWVERERKMAEVRDSKSAARPKAIATRLNALELQITSPGRRERSAVRVGHQRGHRRTAWRARASRSIAARFCCLTRSRHSARTPCRSSCIATSRRR